ncbi:MAG: glucosaminidase domain-containing protein [Bdellovibrionales bacterium]
MATNNDKRDQDKEKEQALQARQAQINSENERVARESEASRQAAAAAAAPMMTMAMMQVLDVPELPRGYDETGGPTKAKKFIDPKSGEIRPSVEVQHESGKGGAKWEGKSFGPLSENRKQRIFQLMNIAKETYPNSPVMQRISIAQAINESGWDVNSGLARQNNLFGIKGKGTAGSVNMGTFEEVHGKNVHIKAGFAANETVEDSFAQHRHLMRRDRYARVRTAGDFNSAAHGLVSAGYATDSSYAEKLMKIDQKLGPYWAQMDNGMSNVAQQQDIPKPAGRELPNAPQHTNLASLKNLPVANDGVHLDHLDPRFAERLGLVMDDLKQQGYDAVIGSGERTVAEQADKVRQGYSHTMKSNHLHRDGNDVTAVDITQRGKPWGGSEAFQQALGKAAKSHGLEWGGDWDATFAGPGGKKVKDVAHVQLPKSNQLATEQQRLQKDVASKQQVVENKQVKPPISAPSV